MRSSLLRYGRGHAHMLNSTSTNSLARVSTYKHSRSFHISVLLWKSGRRFIKEEDAQCNMSEVYLGCCRGKSWQGWPGGYFIMFPSLVIYPGQLWFDQRGGKGDVPVHWWKGNLAGIPNGKMWCLKVLYLQDILHVLSTERMGLQRCFTRDKGDKNKNVGGRWTWRSFIYSHSTKRRIRAATRGRCAPQQNPRVTFFSLCQCNTDSMNAASTTHPVDMLERQEKIFVFAHFQ